MRTVDSKRGVPRAGNGIDGAAVLVALLAVLANGKMDATRGAEPTIQRITQDGLFKQRPHWSPDGRSLVFARHRGATIYLYLLDMANGTEQRLTERDAPEFDAVFSPNGKQMAFAFDKTSPNQGDLEVYRLHLPDRSLTPLAVTQGGLSHEESPCWSPDGKQVAFTSTKFGNQELFVMPADGGEWSRLTSDPAIDAHPAWSPDGQAIAFATNRWGDLEIALIAPDGTNLRRFTDSPGLDDYPAWSPDGRQLAFTSYRDGNADIYIADVAAGTVVNVTAHPAIDNFPSWLPDGRLGMVSNRDGGFDIYVIDVRHP